MILILIEMKQTKAENDDWNIIVSNSTGSKEISLSSG